MVDLQFERQLTLECQGYVVPRNTDFLEAVAPFETGQRIINPIDVLSVDQVATSSCFTPLDRLRDQHVCNSSVLMRHLGYDVHHAGELAVVCHLHEADELVTVVRPEELASVVVRRGFGLDAVKAL